MVSVTQEPNQYNLAVMSNVYTLSGLTTEDAYVINVKLSDGTTIAQVKQPANPAGVAHFDISKILQAYMDIKFTEETLRVTPTDGTGFEYYVQAGSVTDNIVTIDWTTGTKSVFNGYDSWRLLNWDYDPYFLNPTAITCETAQGSTNARYTTKSYLTNFPESEYKVRGDQWHTMSFMNRIGNFAGGPDWGLNTQPAYVEIAFYDVSGSLIQTTIYEISLGLGLGPRVSYNSSTIGAYTDAELVGTVGAGPLNLKTAGLWPQSSSAIWNQIVQVWGGWQQIWSSASSTAIVDHYTVNIRSMDICQVDALGLPANSSAQELSKYLGDVLYTSTFKVAEPCTGYDPITVSFLNKYGVKDYYTFDRRNTQSQRIGRNNYTQTLGSWSDATFAIDYYAGRGRKTFSTEITTQMTMNSYWMGDEEAAWLEELFDSPHVNVYVNGLWEPAVITSSSYQQKTATRNGLFQYQLEVQFANNKNVQKG